MGQLGTPQGEKTTNGGMLVLEDNEGPKLGAFCQLLFAIYCFPFGICDFLFAIFYFLFAFCQIVKLMSIVSAPCSSSDSYLPDSA